MGDRRTLRRRPRLSCVPASLDPADREGDPWRIGDVDFTWKRWRMSGKAGQMYILACLKIVLAYFGSQVSERRLAHACGRTYCPICFYRLGDLLLFELRTLSM